MFTAAQEVCAAVPSVSGQTRELFNEVTCGERPEERAPGGVPPGEREILLPQDTNVTRNLY